MTIAVLINGFIHLNELFFLRIIVKLIIFIMYKLPCLLYSHANFIMVITSVPPGTLACGYLDCSIRIYSLMYKRISFGYVMCVCVFSFFLFIFNFFFFYIIGRQKIKFLTKSGTLTDCLMCAGCSCDGVIIITEFQKLPSA